MKEKDLGWNRIKKRSLKRFVSIKVGVISAEEQSKEAHERVENYGFREFGKPTVAEYAIQNEFGTDKIPARPALRNAIDENEKKIRKFKQKVIQKYLIDGKLNEKQAGSLIGFFVRSLMQRSITDLKSPPNAPSTIARKGSSNPLIDTGRYRQSINYKVTTKKIRDF